MQEEHFQIVGRTAGVGKMCVC